MSTKEIPDIGDMYDFYKLWNDELRSELIGYIEASAELYDVKWWDISRSLLDKIESLGKKEQNGN